LNKDLGQQLEQLQDEGFEVLKFKMGRHFKDEYSWLMKVNLKTYLVRVDLNSIMNFKDAKEALAMLKKIPNLEYVEDPMPYGDYHWSELQKITPLGLDHYDGSAPPTQFQFRIVKPIRGFSLSQLEQWTYEKKKIVLTNMMDNVVGAWKTYLYYCELKKHLPYHLCTPGFHTHNLYHNYEHESLLAFKGAQWTFDKDKLAQMMAMFNKLGWIEVNYLDTRNLDEILLEAKLKAERER
jgi:hypothetical protein